MRPRPPPASACLPASLESLGRISSGTHWYWQGPGDLSLSVIPLAAASVVSDPISAFTPSLSHSPFSPLIRDPLPNSNCLSFGAHHSCAASEVMAMSEDKRSTDGRGNRSQPQLPSNVPPPRAETTMRAKKRIVQSVIQIKTRESPRRNLRKCTPAISSERVRKMPKAAGRSICALYKHTHTRPLRINIAAARSQSVVSPFPHLSFPHYAFVRCAV